MVQQLHCNIMGRTFLLLWIAVVSAEAASSSSSSSHSPPLQHPPPPPNQRSQHNAANNADNSRWNSNSLPTNRQQRHDNPENRQSSYQVTPNYSDQWSFTEDNSAQYYQQQQQQYSTNTNTLSSQLTPQSTTTERTWTTNPLQQEISSTENRSERRDSMEQYDKNHHHNPSSSSAHMGFANDHWQTPGEVNHGSLLAHQLGSSRDFPSSLPAGDAHATYSMYPGQQDTPASNVHSGSSSTWKKLWSRMEQGLDELVKMEDVISHKAKNLVLKTVPVSKSTPLSESQPVVPITASTTILSSPPQPSSRTIQVPPTPSSFSMSSSNPMSVVLPDTLSTKQSALPLNSSPRKSEGFSEQHYENNQVTQQTVKDMHKVPEEPKVASSGGALSRSQNKWKQDEVSSKVLQTTGEISTSQTDSTPPQQQGHDVTGSTYRYPPAVSVPPTQGTATRVSTPATSRTPRLLWESGGSKPAVSSAPHPPTRRDWPDDDFDEKPSMFRIFSRIPSIPNPLRIFRFRKSQPYQHASIAAWNNEDDDRSKRRGLLGLFRRKQKDDLVLLQAQKGADKMDTTLAPPIESILERCDHGKSSSLLSVSDRSRCRSIGRTQAVFDVVSVSLRLLGWQQVNFISSVPIPTSISELKLKTIPALGENLRLSLDTLAPELLLGAYLVLLARQVLLSSRVKALRNQVQTSLEEESRYAQLYLRLVAAVRLDPKLPSNLAMAGASQVESLIATSRLNAFVVLILSSLVLLTVSWMGPLLQATGSSLTKLIQMYEQQTWPVDWKSVALSIQSGIQSLLVSAEGLVAQGLSSFLANPMQFAVSFSIVISLLLVTLIPGIEKRRAANVNPREEEGVDPYPSESAEQLGLLGASSATRLGIQSVDGAIERVLERWRMSRTCGTEDAPTILLTSVIRKSVYTILLALTLSLPVAVSLFIRSGFGMVSPMGVQWDSVLEVSVILVDVFFVAGNAISRAIRSTQSHGSVQSFLQVLSKTIDEIKGKMQHRPGLQFMASVNSSAGLVVKDLWAAHSTKRAWAVRGANLQCKNGEVLVILGDDGAGKSRLVTTIAETLIAPPQRSLTSNVVRGFVGIGGVESSKWEKAVLKKRLGIFLSDVRSMTDTANLYSGCTMEEILEPVDHKCSHSDEKRNHERSSILLALKITGLYGTLIPKLPSKLATVVTANEEDLRPSVLRPRGQVLSPAEWSKLILTQVLAQSIYDNDNVAASTDRVENCLMGSVLLLDDPTMLLTEVEEGKLLKDLRQTGAATIITTNKWATGRFADCIAVVKDGAIVESGTHNELIARGAQQSLYAAKWHAMTMQ